MTEWFISNPHIILTKCITYHQDHTNNDTNKERYKLINQGVKTTNDQYYIAYQKSIISITVTGSDIYDKYSYTSCVNWKIKKTPENPSKKLEFNIDKPKTGLKKTYFNIITNNDTIDDINDNTMVCHTKDLTNNVYGNTKHMNIKQEQTTHNSLYPLANSKL